MKRFAVGILWLSPLLILLGLFTVWPAFRTVDMSFYTRYNYFRDLVFERGLDNYAYLWNDPEFWRSLGNTFFYTAWTPVLLCRNRAGARPCAERYRAVQEAVSDDLLPALRHLYGGDRAGLELDLSPRSRPFERHAAGDRTRPDPLASGPPVGARFPWWSLGSGRAPGTTS